MLYAGLDGGGTRTRVLLADAAGSIVARGESGPGNYHDVGVERVCQHFREAFDEAWSQLQRSPEPLRALCFGLASVSTPEDREIIRAGVASFPERVGAHLDVVHDLRIAHAGALAGAPGIVLIVGTGSSCWGLDPCGNHWQAGGWGSLLDDGGSATFLGIQGMIAAIHDLDARGPRTSLKELVLEQLQITELRDLLRIVDHDGLPRTQIARLAPGVLAAAEAGDEAALEIRARGVETLSKCAVAVASQLRFDTPFPISASGGLVEGNTPYRLALHHSLKEALPLARPQDPQSSPAEGALRLAMSTLG